MSKIYLPSSIDNLMCVDIKLGKNIPEKIVLRGDYIPNIDDIDRIIDYYNDCVKYGLNGDYVKDRVYGKRVILENLIDLFGTEKEAEALNILSTLEFGDSEEISFQRLKDSTLKNAEKAYELYGEKSLIYSLLDYRDLLTSSFERVSVQYRKEALENSKVLSLAYMKSNKKSKEV